MNDEDTARLQKGRQMMHSISPQVGDSMVQNLRAIAPDFEDLLVGFAFADIWARPALSLRERALIRLGALSALGAPTAGTRANIDSARHIGLSDNDIAEAFLQTLPYAGFPHVITALEILSNQKQPDDDGPLPGVPEQRQSPESAVATASSPETGQFTAR